MLRDKNSCRLWILLFFMGVLFFFTSCDDNKDEEEKPQKSAENNLSIESNKSFDNRTIVRPEGNNTIIHEGNQTESMIRQKRIQAILDYIPMTMEQNTTYTNSVPSKPVFDLSSRNSHPPLANKDEYLSWMLSHTPDQEKFLKSRWDRMQADLKRFYDQTPDVMEAFLLTPREEFVRSYNLHRAYDHAWLVIEDSQTISGPHLVIRMTQAIRPGLNDKCLEIGTGSGYQAAVLSQMSNFVYTIEIKKNLQKVTEGIYAVLEKKYPNIRNIKRKQGDGYYGWPEFAPFDRIIVTCAIDHIPPPLLEQLAPNGIMCIPVGPIGGHQVVLKITKRVDAGGKITLEREDIFGGRLLESFVPFTAADGSWHTKAKTQKP